MPFARPHRRHPDHDPRTTASRRPDRHRPARRARLALALVRRTSSRLARRLTLWSGWIWVAAVSLVGVEVFEVVFGAFLLAPEFLPLALLALALAYWARRSIRRRARALRVRRRAVRAARR